MVQGALLSRSTIMIALSRVCKLLQPSQSPHRCKCVQQNTSGSGTDRRAPIFASAVARRACAFTSMRCQPAASAWRPFCTARSAASSAVMTWSQSCVHALSAFSFKWHAARLSLHVAKCNRNFSVRAASHFRGHELDRPACNHSSMADAAHTAYKSRQPCATK